jgi:hypothetical protein
MKLSLELGFDVQNSTHAPLVERTIREKGLALAAIGSDNNQQQNEKDDGAAHERHTYGDYDDDRRQYGVENVDY